jgi:adenine-specific DNA-methyltransferase
LPIGVSAAPEIEGLVAILPIRRNKSEGNWQWSPQTFRERLEQGRVKIGGTPRRGFTVYILKPGEYDKIQTGEFKEVGRAIDGSLIVEGNDPTNVTAIPGTQWKISSHDATQYGSRLLVNVLPNRKFPFPKSLYAVEDSLRFFVKEKPEAVILDFFAGSGTTAHAVMRLNREIGGKRQCISVTNNEVSADEQKALREQNLRPGDPEWDKFGICDYITKPRVESAITGKTPGGEPIEGDYQFGKTVEKERPRKFTQIGFTEAIVFDSAAKKKQLLALVQGLPQTLVTEPCHFIVSEEHASSILFDTKWGEDWLEALDGQEHITDFYIVTPVKRAFDTLKKQVAEMLGPLLESETEKVPMADGFEENAEFFTLTYETPLAVSYQTAFTRIAPLLWLRAGSVGRRIEKVPSAGWDVADAYGLLVELDTATDFLKAVRKAKALRIAYIVTDDERRFQALARRLPEGVEATRLYESYLTNFAFANGDDA